MSPPIEGERQSTSKIEQNRSRAGSQSKVRTLSGGVLDVAQGQPAKVTVRLPMSSGSRGNLTAPHCCSGVIRAVTCAPSSHSHPFMNRHLVGCDPHWGHGDLDPVCHPCSLYFTSSGPGGLRAMHALQRRREGVAGAGTLPGLRSLVPCAAINPWLAAAEGSPLVLSRPCAGTKHCRDSPSAIRCTRLCPAPTMEKC